MRVFFSRLAPKPEPVLDYDIALALHTETGPVREHNEDYIASLVAPRAGRADRAVLVALADGMGGHQAGELASRLAVQAALARFAEPVADTVAQLHRALVAANEAVYTHAQQQPQYQGMGTTLLLVAPAEAGMSFAWVGDSRLYHWRDGTLAQLTRDDTLVRALLDRGLIDRDEAAGHEDHSVLTQAVGTHSAIPSPHVEGPIALAHGDRFLLCSDGVHDVVGDAELQQLLAAGSPKDAMRAIFDAALRHGANDNLSIGVLQVLRPADPTRGARRTRHDVEVSS